MRVILYETVMSELKLAYVTNHSFPLGTLGKNITKLVDVANQWTDNILHSISVWFPASSMKFHENQETNHAGSNIWDWSR